MKKGFGWFFIVLGALNVFRAFVMFSQQAGNGGGILFWGIGFIGFGSWLISSTKPKEENSNLPDKTKDNALMK